MKIKTEIKFISNLNPKVEAFVKSVCDGVWYVYIDWFDAFELCGTGGNSENKGLVEMYFAHPSTEYFDFQVDFHFPTDGFLFGSVYKKSYHGTYYVYDMYEKLVGNLS